MRVGTDATAMNDVFFHERQHTPAVEGLQVGLVATCTASVITFTLPGFSSVAGLSAALPSGWPQLAAGTEVLLGFVRNAWTGTLDVWAIAYR